MRADDLVTASFVTQESDGRTIHAFAGTAGDRVEQMRDKAAAKALRDGKQIVHDDGRKEWIAVEAKFVDGEHVWHEDGSRIKVERLHVVWHPGGKRTTVKLGESWRSYERFYA